MNQDGRYMDPGGLISPLCLRHIQSAQVRILTWFPRSFTIEYNGSMVSFKRKPRGNPREASRRYYARLRYAWPPIQAVDSPSHGRFIKSGSISGVRRSLPAGGTPLADCERLLDVGTRLGARSN